MSKINPVWHGMLHSCTHMATVDVKWLTMSAGIVCCMTRSCDGGAERGHESGVLRATIPAVRSRRSATSLLQVVRSRRSHRPSTDIISRARVPCTRNRLSPVPVRRPRRSVLSV